MNSLRTSMLVGAVVASATCLACSDGTVGIGEDNPQSAKTGLAAYAGSWDGYVEAYTFESGSSDRVRLVMDEQGKGEIRFGDRELLAKPTDPNVQYCPPQAEQFGPMDRGWGYVYEGFGYPLQGSIVESARIRSGVSAYEIYSDYCAIQTAPYPCRPLPEIDPSVVDYSKTPVTYAGLRTVDGVSCVVIYDQAPTTVEQLTTNSTHTVPWSEFGVTSADIEAFNLNHPDSPLLADNPVVSICVRTADGTYQVDPARTQNLDIKLDGALENEGNFIVGSLTLLGAVRTVRLTRVQ